MGMQNGATTIGNSTEIAQTVKNKTTLRPQQAHFYIFNNNNKHLKSGLWRDTNIWNF